MPGNESEIPILVREFAGVDIQTDPAFLPNDILQASQNLVPTFTYLLAKRQGAIRSPITLNNDGLLPWANPRVDVIRWALQNDGTNLVFFVVTTEGDGVSTAKGDRLLVGLGSPPVIHELYNFDNGSTTGVDPTGAYLGTSGARYGMTILGGKLYVGNGLNALIVVDIENPLATPTPLIQLGTFSMANTASINTSTQAQGLVPGTYSYRWVYLDSSTDPAQFLSAGPTGTFVATGTDPLAIDFVGPTNAEIAAATDPTLTALDGNHTVHLFLSPPGLPIEYARDHGMVEAGTPVTLTISTYNATGDLVPLQGAAYTGRYLVRHRGRIWIAGDQTDGGNRRSRLYATNAIVPGLEQQLYNWGDFFPSGANAPINDHDGDEITGLAVAQGAANRDVAFSPLVIFKNAACYLWFGDIVDDDQAVLIQMSDTVGCVAPQTIVPTSEGVIFMGIDTVYYLGTGFSEPIDIGIPIRPSIEDIPSPRLAFATAVFHRGWYKLAITPPGGDTNSIEWWFDLRTSTSSAKIVQESKWWGPHVCMGASTMADGVLDPEERERLYIGRDVPFTETPGVVDVAYGDQTGVFTDLDPAMSNAVVPITARLRTGGLVQNEPFQWKDWTSIRIVTRPDRDSPVTVSIYAEGGPIQIEPTMNQNRQLDDTSPTIADNIIYAGLGSSLWDVALWDVGLWGVRQFVEGWTELVPVIRAHELEIELTHNDPTGILLRDLEVRYRPVQRRAPGAV